MYRLYSLIVEAGFYGHIGRVIGFFSKLSNAHCGKYVDGVTAMLDFVEDWQTLHTGYFHLLYL